MFEDGDTALFTNTGIGQPTFTENAGDLRTGAWDLYAVFDHPGFVGLPSRPARRLLLCAGNRGVIGFLWMCDYNLFRTMQEMDIYQLIATKKAEISALAESYGASNIRIFGSVARHTADEKSDVDLLVELEPGRTLFDLGGLTYDLEALLGRHVDVCTVPLLREQMRARVISEAIPL